jgi:hypothetical protein
MGMRRSSSQVGALVTILLHRAPASANREGKREKEIMLDIERIETPIDEQLRKAQRALVEIEESAQATARRMMLLEEVLQQKGAMVPVMPLAVFAEGECCYELRQESQVTGEYFAIIHWIKEAEPDFVELMDMETFLFQSVRYVGDESHQKQMAIHGKAYERFKLEIQNRERPAIAVGAER